MQKMIATLGGGCFWGVEAALRRLPGVVDTRSGYMGGSLANPTYEDVCEGDTGHAEVVEVQYDPAQLRYAALLEAFWRLHNPTHRDRQGDDVGPQYRSVIFYHGEEQRQMAEQSRAALAASGRFADPIATEILPANAFFPAEEYHQRYLEKRGLSACHWPG